MKRSKIATLLLTGALSVSMLAAGALTAFAADGDPTPATDAQKFTNEAELKIQKIINYADGVTVPAQDFTFSIEQNTADSVKAVSLTTPVTISSQEISASTKAGAGKYNQEVLASDAIDIEALKGTPGLYVYTVKETSENVLDNEQYGWTMNTSADEYTLRIYVDKDGKVTYTIENKGTKIEKLVPSAEEGSDYVTGGFSFTNQYTKKGEKNVENSKGSLTIEKKIEGSYADKEDQFDYTVTFTDTSINPAYTVKSADGSTVSFTGNEFTLKGGQSATFENIPAGTYYTVSETMKDSNTQKYDAAYVATQNGNAGTSTKATTTGSLLVGEGANSVVYTNTAKDITITGLALQAAPYVALIGLALVMMAAYVVLRRRAENN